MMRWLRKLHAWAGMGLCLLMAAIALSGALLAFKPELRRLAHPETRGPPPAVDAAALSRVMRAAEASAPGEVRSVTFASASTALHEAALKDGGVVTLDGAGRVAGRWAENARFLDWVFDFHHHLLAGETGTAVTGWAGVAGLLMVVSGLVLWWPARRSFKGRVVPGRGRAGWLTAHRDLAVMTAPMVALSLTTGAAMALQTISRPLMNAPAPVSPVARTTGPVDWGAALAVAQAHFPEATLRIAAPPAKSGAPVTVRLRQPHEWHSNGRTIVYLEPATAAVIGVHDDRTQSRGGRLYNVLWPIHAAKVGGPAWKTLLALGGLALVLLSLYGGEAYRRRLFRGR